ncbi:hypothetical protein L6E12_32045 [Actinokineospora sp. PR83]|uniref:hypothetical protein n=1 Tax=Actinokineospora sp. PR83 TaxID=2884908 RepID=UPI001F28B54E|nr:hypothetical protein [Actinokineospora sp. PR83]MCG8920409.1 hypothetical protein [Actinokineospora sp. PR83]
MRGKAFVAMVAAGVAAAVAFPTPAFALGDSADLMPSVDYLKRNNCDGVLYPVADNGVRRYTANAGTPQRVGQKSSATLTATDTTAQTEQVQTQQGLSVQGKVSLGKIPLSSGEAGADASVTYSTATTHTDGTTVTYSTANSIKVTSLGPALTVTPTYFKVSATGSYYRCQVQGSTRTATREGLEGDFEMDVVEAEGWRIACSPASPCKVNEQYTW